MSNLKELFPVPSEHNCNDCKNNIYGFCGGGNGMYVKDLVTCCSGFRPKETAKLGYNPKVFINDDIK